MTRKTKVTLKNHLITDPNTVVSTTEKVFQNPQSAQAFADIWSKFKNIEIIIQKCEDD